MAKNDRQPYGNLSLYARTTTLAALLMAGAGAMELALIRMVGIAAGSSAIVGRMPTGCAHDHAVRVRGKLVASSCRACSGSFLHRHANRNTGRR